MDSFAIIHDLAKAYKIPKLDMHERRLGRKVYNELCGSIVDMLMSDINVLNYAKIIETRSKITNMLS